MIVDKEGEHLFKIFFRHCLQILNFLRHISMCCTLKSMVTTFLVRLLVMDFVCLLYWLCDCTFLKSVFHIQIIVPVMLFPLSLFNTDPLLGQKYTLLRSHCSFIAFTYVFPLNLPVYNFISSRASRLLSCPFFKKNSLLLHIPDPY